MKWLTFKLLSLINNSKKCRNFALFMVQILAEIFFARERCSST